MQSSTMLPRRLSGKCIGNIIICILIIFISYQIIFLTFKPHLVSETNLSHDDQKPQVRRITQGEEHVKVEHDQKIHEAKAKSVGSATTSSIPLPSFTLTTTTTTTTAASAPSAESEANQKDVEDEEQKNDLEKQEEQVNQEYVEDKEQRNELLKQEEQGRLTSLPGDGFFDPKDIDPELGLKYIAKPIPEELVKFVNGLESPHKPPECKLRAPQQNFVYLKTHKTASDTLSAMFRRFAYGRNLSVVLPLGLKYNIGWPYDLVPKYHRPSKTGGFNVLVDHAKYTEKYMRQIMPQDTVYITSWRETFSHLKSSMAYFNIRQWTGIKEDSPDGMEVFLKDLKHYDDLYKVLPPKNPFRSTYPCIPGDISMARNSMAADLGFPVGFPKEQYPDYSGNFTAIKEWLEHTNQVFSVVLISDYFHHSLVMLKRMMCWSSKEILYERMNSWNTKYRSEYRSELVDNFRRWSAADYLAFQLFNQTLWDRIDTWGRTDFLAEVSHLEKTLQTTSAYCMGIKRNPTESQTLTIPASQWDDAYTVTKRDCELITYHMRDTIKAQYDAIPVKVDMPPPGSVPGC